MRYRLVVFHCKQLLRLLFLGLFGDFPVSRTTSGAIMFTGSDEPMYFRKACANGLFFPGGPSEATSSGEVENMMTRSPGTSFIVF
jgi:hypothetical protein